MVVQQGERYGEMRVSRVTADGRGLPSRLAESFERVVKLDNDLKDIAERMSSFEDEKQVVSSEREKAFAEFVAALTEAGEVIGSTVSVSLANTDGKQS